MHIHRSARMRGFDPFPELRPERSGLSKGAFGLAVQILTSPTGCDADGRQLAEQGPDGRAGIARMLRELKKAGFYWVITFRLPDGRIISQSHLFDTPQHVAPDPIPPGPGGPGSGAPDVLWKTREGKPSLPAARTAAEPQPKPKPKPEPESAPAPEPAPEPEVPAESRAAAALLHRVVRPEPRLRIGEVEALELAPLVAEWVRRGSTPEDLSRALVPGLPAFMYSAAAVLRDRLSRKMPPEPGLLPETPAIAAAKSARPRSSYAECAKCHDPVPNPGICGPCAGLAPRPIAVGTGSAAVRAGAQRARAALRSARDTLPIAHRPAPAGT
ncbi:hypothetical protein [Kitasatospora sp. NPDC088783]|uniref:hypothetical protein n=1 Tax=Kitasatospora sp. NPDC088783 TaxID=3364077 RepID=UPI0037F3E8DB